MSRLNRATKQFMDEVTGEVLQSAQAFARPKVAAAGKRGTLAKSMEWILHAKYASRGGEKYAEGSLNIPYDWAIYVHQGRPGGHRRTNGIYYVFWRDPNQDPRLKSTGGVVPGTPSRRKNLKDNQFYEAWERMKQHLRDGGRIETSPVIVTKKIKGGTKGIPFFSNTDGRGMLGFKEIGAKKIESSFDGFVEQQLLSVNRLRVKDTATARI
jgi:hypothetical protein